MKYFKYIDSDLWIFTSSNDAETLVPFLIPPAIGIGNGITQLGIYIEIGSTDKGRNNKLFLKVDPVEGEIITESKKYTNPILASLKEGSKFTLTKLNVLCCFIEVNIGNLPRTVQHLRLDLIEIMNGTTGLQSLVQLETLYISQSTIHTLMLSDLPRGLLELTIGGDIKLNYASDIILDKLKRMRIDKYTELNNGTVERFGEIFPNLEIFIGNSYLSRIVEQALTRMKKMKIIIYNLWGINYEPKFPGIQIIGECKDTRYCKLEKNITTNGSYWDLSEINCTDVDTIINSSFSQS